MNHNWGVLFEKQVFEDNHIAYVQLNQCEVVLLESYVN